jgi:hypothetical protein
MYVKWYVQSKEQNCLQLLHKENNFEMSIVELLDYKIALVCIYGSSNGTFIHF